MKIVRSVGLILFDSVGRVLLVKELESKIHYGKVAGMITVPIETIKNGENRVQALRRLLKEEIGEQIEGPISFYEEFLIRLNDAFTERLYVYKSACKNSFIAHPNDTDIEHFGWMLPQEIYKFSPGRIRLEVEPIMSSYLSRR